ncbi:hypothetical protein [Paraburkholderia sediminicola]|uniref:hypothetical protein n=1 Tax=Paraburkholderia sediminicola TaxID=458836 RepID=UPI0038B73BDE
MTLPTEATVPSVLGIVSTFIGILGGMLGAYTFLDNYILRFKPKFLIGDRIYLTYEKHKKIQEYSHLSSLIIQFEIFNHRNKLGRIEDIFVRIYDSRKLEASVLDLFPLAALDSMPTNRDEVIAAERVPPSPIAIPNKSSKTLVIEMAQEKLHNGTVDPSGFLKVQCLYKSTTGKWRKFSEFSLHAAYEEKSTYDKFTIYNFDRTERYAEREKLKRRKIATEVNSYKGVSNYYLSFWLPRPYWRAKEFVQAAPKLVIFLCGLATATVRNCLSEAIEWRVVKRTAARSRKPKITVGNARNARRTDSLIAKLKPLIEHKVTELNSRAKASDAITIEIVDTSITLKKSGTQVRVYVGGDGFVGILRSPLNSPMGETVFTIRVKEFAFGSYLWTLSGRPVFASTIATRVVDYLAFLHG